MFNLISIQRMQIKIFTPIKLEKCIFIHTIDKQAVLIRIWEKKNKDMGRQTLKITENV